MSRDQTSCMMHQTWDGMKADIPVPEINGILYLTAVVHPPFLLALYILLPALKLDQQQIVFPRTPCNSDFGTSCFLRN